MFRDVQAASRRAAGQPSAPRAFWLAHGMADNYGVHLAQSVAKGLLTRPELHCMLGRRQACTAVAACEQWLAVPRREPDAPDFCATAADIAALSTSLG